MTTAYNVFLDSEGLKVACNNLEHHTTVHETKGSLLIIDTESRFNVHNNRLNVHGKQENPCTCTNSAKLLLAFCT